MIPKQFYYKRNRFQQLRGFCYTVQTGSMSKAGEKIGLSQSAITLQIQSLERDLGISLFKRKNTKLELTEDGRELYDYCISYIHETDSLFENFSKFLGEKQSNIVKIASNHVGISYILPKYIKNFKDSHPSTKLKISNLTQDECISRLLNDEIDMFIYTMNLEEIPAELDFYPIVTYQPILLTRKDHSLARKRKISLSDIAKYELVRIDPQLITLPTFEEIIKAHKIKSNIEFEISDWEILRKFVKAGIGVAMISNIILEGEVENDLTGQLLTDYFPEMTYGIFTKKGAKLQNVANQFYNLLKTEKLLNAQQRQNKKTNNMY